MPRGQERQGRSSDCFPRGRGSATHSTGGSLSIYTAAGTLNSFFDLEEILPPPPSTHTRPRSPSCEFWIVTSTVLEVSSSNIKLLSSRAIGIFSPLLKSVL